MPVGFCCSKCVLYDEHHTCLLSKSKASLASGVKLPEGIKPISTSIEDGLLKVVLKKEEKEIPIYIDLQKQFE
jgi:HSP20 family molecular chaperone IbpA